MTMVVGIHLGDYVFVATDKREVFMVNDQVVSVTSDNVNKLVNWGGGVVTGCGYVPLLSELKSRLSHTNITNTNQIVAMANEVSNSFSTQVTNWKAKTNWMFSYVAATDAGPQCRLGHINCVAPDQVHMLHEMRATIWAKLPDIDQRVSELTKALKPLQSPEQFQDNLAYHIDLVRNLFEYGSSKDETVCKDFDFYIQFRTGESFLSSEA